LYYIYSQGHKEQNVDGRSSENHENADIGQKHGFARPLEYQNLKKVPKKQ